MSLDDPVIITCSISGAVANREQCPAIPYTPEEYAAEARRIVDEGGVHIHIHARKPDGTPSYEVEDFQAIKDAIVGEIGDAAIINIGNAAEFAPASRLWRTDGKRRKLIIMTVRFATARATITDQTPDTAPIVVPPH